MMAKDNSGVFKNCNNHIREKLLDLIIEAKKADTEDAPFSEFLADFMIANGVTIQEWIPASERLPDGECLAVSMLKYQPSYKEMLVGYVAKDARYETGYCCESDDVILPNVTHWTEKPYPAEGGA